MAGVRHPALPTVINPHPVLPLPCETARLLLRAHTSADTPALQAAIEESFADLHPWMPWAAELQTLEETTAFLQKAETAFHTGEDFAVLAFLWTTGEFVLGTGVHPRNWRVPKFEIGYWCRRSMQRKGYTLEAVDCLTRLAFSEMGAERLEILCDSQNDASRKVAEKAGYHHEALLRAEDRANDGSLRNTVIYALLREAPAFSR